MLKYLLITLFSLTSIASFSQRQIFGKVLNEKNEPVVSASVVISKTNRGATTNNQGNYSLNVNAGTYEITVTALGYETKIVSDIEVGAKDAEINITLAAASNKLDEVTVTTRRTSARLETSAAAIAFQKNTNTVAQVVSAEMIKRSPDRTTGEVIKRTPGTSLQDGRFLVVRGLADRYNLAMINGVPLSSTEADRKSFSFDLIPSAMIDNIVINKAFVPEFPSEWAGGLIQVNTRDIPTRNFFNIQIGTGFNTQAISNDFMGYKGGKTDWLGIDDGTRKLPTGIYTTKNKFDALEDGDKIAFGKQFRNVWSGQKMPTQLNASFQANGGFAGKLFNKKIGGSFALTYNRNARLTNIENNNYSAFDGTPGNYSVEFEYKDKRYTQEVLWGALGNLALQLNNDNRISAKVLLNINSTDFLNDRVSGVENRGLGLTPGYGAELGFRQNTFLNTQLTGDHALFNKQIKLRWYGSFNILDSYVPDQRRIMYFQDNGPSTPYLALISNTLSQRSGNIYYQFLNDYTYTAGGDASHQFNWLDYKQTIKGGYLFQVRDRVFDAKPFSVYLPVNNEALKALPADQIFAPQNFGDGTDNKFAFDAIQGDRFRYIANTILNAGYVQFDNQFTEKLRAVWGVRVEHFDQLVGSKNPNSDKFSNSKVLDWLPGANFTYKLTDKTNLRLSGSQTVIRPELRELATLNYFDFELNASVQGDPKLKRTKVTNADLRYEIYPRAGELFTAGVFYKNFRHVVVPYFNVGSGGASTYYFVNYDEANAYGAEIEFKKKLDFISQKLQNLSFQANVAYIYSNIEEYDQPLQGQSPYVLNFGLLYDMPKPQMNVTVLFNQIGRRIAYYGDQDQDQAATWEAPRPVLDLQVSKKLMKGKGELKLNVSDILNQKLYFYYNSGDNDKREKAIDPNRFVRQYGTNVSLTFGYSF